MPSGRTRRIVSHSIAFSPEAREDLRKLYVDIAVLAGESVALRYVERIEAYCRGFAIFPERGARRDDLAPGLRIIGFERRVTLAFHVDATTVAFDRILYGGRNLAGIFDDD